MFAGIRRNIFIRRQFLRALPHGILIPRKLLRAFPHGIWIPWKILRALPRRIVYSRWIFVQMRRRFFIWFQVLRDDVKCDEDVSYDSRCCRTMWCSERTVYVKMVPAVWMCLVCVHANKIHPNPPKRHHFDTFWRFLLHCSWKWRKKSVEGIMWEVFGVILFGCFRCFLKSFWRF